MAFSLLGGGFLPVPPHFACPPLYFPSSPPPSYTHSSSPSRSTLHAPRSGPSVPFKPSPDTRPSILGSPPFPFPWLDVIGPRQGPIWGVSSQIRNAHLSLLSAVQSYQTAAMYLLDTLHTFSSSYPVPPNPPFIPSPPIRNHLRHKSLGRQTGGQKYVRQPGSGSGDVAGARQNPSSASVGPAPLPVCPLGPSPVHVGPSKDANCPEAKQQSLHSLPSSSSCLVSPPLQSDEEGWTTVTRKHRHSLVTKHGTCGISASASSPAKVSSVLQCLDDPNSLASKLKSDLVKEREDAFAKKGTTVLPKRLCPKAKDPMFVWS